MMGGSTSRASGRAYHDSGLDENQNSMEHFSSPEIQQERNPSHRELETVCHSLFIVLFLGDLRHDVRKVSGF